MYIAVFRTFSVLSANTKTPNFYYSLHHIVFSGCICYSFFIDNSSALAAISFMPFWLLISGNERLWELYLSWKEEQQKEFLDFCTGIKGVKNFRMTPRVLQMKAPLLSWIL